MNRKRMLMAIATLWFGVLSGLVISAQDKYTVRPLPSAIP